MEELVVWIKNDDVGQAEYNAEFWHNATNCKHNYLDHQMTNLSLLDLHTK